MHSEFFPNEENQGEEEDDCLHHHKTLTSAHFLPWLPWGFPLLAHSTKLSKKKRSPSLTSYETMAGDEQT